MTWIMSGNIMRGSRICSITYIIQNTLFRFVLFQISFCYASGNTKPKIKQDKSKTNNYIKSNLPTTCLNDCLKVKVHELVRSLVKCQGMEISQIAKINGSLISHSTQMHKYLRFKYSWVPKNVPPEFSTSHPLHSSMLIWTAPFICFSKYFFSHLHQKWRSQYKHSNTKISVIKYEKILW